MQVFGCALRANYQIFDIFYRRYQPTHGVILLFGL